MPPSSESCLNYVVLVRALQGALLESRRLCASLLPRAVPTFRPRPRAAERHEVGKVVLGGGRPAAPEGDGARRHVRGGGGGDGGGRGEQGKVTEVIGPADGGGLGSAHQEPQGRGQGHRGEGAGLGLGGGGQSGGAEGGEEVQVCHVKGFVGLRERDSRRLELWWLWWELLQRVGGGESGREGGLEDLGLVWGV